MMLPLATVVMAWSLCRLLLSARSPLNIIDAPNERSLHEIPTPRTGGVAILLALAVAYGVTALFNDFPEQMGWIVTAALLVAGISFADDLRELSPLVRMLVHALAAGLLVANGFVLFNGWFGTFFSWLAIIWMLNLYNFMDGMDGFAGGMTVAGFGFMAVAGWLQGNSEFLLYSSLVTAAALGFLPVNFPPAKIFMGDIGSATLGLLAAAFGLWGVQAGVFSWWFPLLVFSPFVVDATVTLVRRAIKRERIWEAHRSHYYQRLVQMGWGHKRTVLAEYVMMMAAGGSALFAHQIGGALVIIVVLAVWAAIYLLIAVQVHRAEAVSDGI